MNRSGTRFQTAGVQTAGGRASGLIGTGLLTVGLLASGPALAQSAGTLNLSAYQTMSGALQQAVNDRAVSSASSLADLDRASAAYATLKPGIDSSLLADGIDRALQSSRAALSRAPADLEAQVDQARSLLRKALYDQTLSAVGRASSTDLDQARLLAGEFGLQNETRTGFLSAVSAHDAGAAARLLRRAAAQKVQSSLEAASVPQNSAQRATSYLALAEATGWFTVVQDAPDTGGLKLSQFSQALGALTQGNTAALSTDLTTLKSGASAFVRATTLAVQRGRSVAQSSPGTATTSTVPTVPATSTQTGVTPAATPQAAQTTGTQTSAPQTSTGQTPTTPSSTGGSGLNAAYAALARAQSAAGHADLQTARTELGLAAQALNGNSLKSTDGYDALVSDLDAAQNRSGVRAGEVQALIAELGNLESRAGAQPTSTLDSLSTGVARIGAPIWPLLFLIVGLLSLYPLYLLNLAFGGRNNYWRAIAVSLGLLFLPVLLEGLGGFFAYLGDLSGAPFLRSLGNLSLRQGAWGLPVWLLLAAGAVALSSYGFRGLCRQFGLLGGSGGSANPTRTDTAQPALDWDEEL